MQSKLTQIDGGSNTRSAYRRAKGQHCEAIRLIEIAGMCAMDAADDNRDMCLRQYGVAEKDEIKLRRVVAEAPIMTDEARDKATYFRELIDHDWIDVNMNDMRAVLLSIEQMRG